MRQRRSVRTVVVEDEPLARRALAEMVRATAWLDLVAEVADGRTAVEVLTRERPELVFLDVQLPELSGLDVLARVEHEPFVVFTTAYDRYAVTAFELGAVDYLLKPFGPERFEKAVERLRHRIGQGAGSPRARASELFETSSPIARLFVREEGSILPVRVDDVVRLEAAGDYVVVHLADARHVLSANLSDLEARLDPRRFVRVHRSHLVNFDHVVEMTACDRRLAIRMSDGSEILASRARSAALRRQLG